MQYYQLDRVLLVVFAEKGGDWLSPIDGVYIYWHQGVIFSDH